MRRISALLMMLLTACFCGCQSEESTLRPAIEFRADLVQAGGCNFSAEVEADFGDTTEQFSLYCEAQQDSMDITVTAPETLEGITAHITGDGGRITYEGMSAEFGLLANGNVSPAAAPAITAACWQREYISAAGQEDDGLYRVTYEKDYDEKRLIVDTWFKNDLPIYAEVCYNNQRILKLTITDFALNG